GHLVLPVVALVAISQNPYSSRCLTWIKAWRGRAARSSRHHSVGRATMTAARTEQGLIVFFRLTMAWTFLYAASHQVFDPSFTVVSFLKTTKTFHDLFAIFTTPAMAPVTTFLVEYGHLAIGLSLLVGFMVRVSAVFGVLLMAIYWMAHMNWPFIENTNNFV